MTKEKKKRVVGKSEILILLGTLILIGFLAYVFGATLAITFPVNGGNYSGIMYLNCTTTLNHTGGSKGINITFFYNKSGGNTGNSSTLSSNALGNNLTGILQNTTNNGNLTAYNSTVDTTILPDSRLYNITCYVNNGTNNETVSVGNITIDNTPPAVSFVATNISNFGNYSNTAFVLNVSVIDATIGMVNGSNGTMNGAGSVYVNITNGSSGAQVGGVSFNVTNFTKLFNNSMASYQGGYYNATINFTGFPDGKYNITIWANDSSLLNQTTFSTNAPRVNLNNTERIQITIDTTAPTAPVLTNTTSTTTTQIVGTITVSDATTGVNYCIAGGSPAPTITGRGTGTQTLTHTGLSCGTSYSYTLNCYDYMGKSSSSVTSLSTRSCSSDKGSSPGGSGPGPGTTTAIEKKFSSLNILPSQEAVLSGFQETMGVEEIKIRVNEVANNVKITVKKYDTQPSEITVPKTGQVHKYIQIITENLGTKFEGATLKFKVQKNWLSDNSIDKANIALFRLDESAGEWEDLTAVYKEEDATYYYYEAQLDSFSYFAIAEKSVVLPGEPEAGESEPTGELPSVTFLKKNWVWIVVGAVVLIGVVGGLLAKKGRKKR